MPCLSAPALTRVDRRTGGAGQIDAHRRALSDLAVEANMAAALFDETVGHAEPQARALAFALGAEERIEGARSMVSGLMPVPVSVTASMTYCPAGTSGSADT